jgi:hypothetical protein
MSAIWPFLFWLAWGVWIATGDLHSSSVMPAVIKLGIGGAVLAFASPRGWWIWALALSAWVPLEPLVAEVMKMEGTSRSALLGTVLPPIPALIGGVVGRAFRGTV